MSTESQVMALFAKANPVPSMDLLDPIEPIDLGHLERLPERSSEMSEIRTIEPERDEQPRQRPLFGLVAAGIMVLAAVAGIFALANRQPEVVAAPVEVGEAFMAALNAHDADTVLSLLADDVLLDGIFNDSVDNVRPAIRQEEVLGWTYDHISCSGSASPLARCVYVWSNHLARAVGAGPYGGSVFAFTIEDGKIQEVRLNEQNAAFQNGALMEFWAWIQENHPVELTGGGGMYYHYRDEAGLAKWEQFVPEFLADMEAGG